MLNKKKYLLLTFFLIIIFQCLLYTNNKQRTSFRYFKWTIQEISIGKLISISFFSGLFISSLLNTTTHINKKNNLENIEENYEPLHSNEDNNSNLEMPPQRNIRDVQPTISVNYRVIKNTEEKNSMRDKNLSNSPVNKDDWNNEENDW